MPMLRLPLVRSLRLLAASILFSTPAVADPIVPVAQIRSHTWSEYEYGELIDGATTSATDFDPFAVGTRHISSIGASQLDGELRANGWADEFADEFEHAESSLFQLDFDLEEALAFALVASLQQDTIVFPANASSRITFSSFDGGLGSFVPVFDYWISGEEDLEELDVQESGVLPAGQYRLRAQVVGASHIHSALGGVGSDASLSFTFTVPEPSTGVLLLAGVVWVAARGRSARPS